MNPIKINTHLLPLKWARIYFDASDTWFYGLNKKHKGLIQKVGGKTFVNLNLLNEISADHDPRTIRV